MRRLEIHLVPSTAFFVGLCLATGCGGTVPNVGKTSHTTSIGLSTGDGPAPSQDGTVSAAGHAPAGRAASGTGGAAANAGPANAGPAPASQLTLTADSATINIPPRVQWMENYGYCGEMSFISAGLHFGQYLSQYDARAIATPGVDQTTAQSQLLLGVNDGPAATAIHMQAEEWDSSQGDTTKFLAWVKQHIAAGHPVVIGVKMLDGTDDLYDHIVPVFEVTSNHAISDGTYYRDDVLYFNDLGVEGDQTVFNYSFASFQDSSLGAPYSLATTTNYGIAFSGVADTAGATLPVTLQTSTSEEDPAIVGGSRPAAETVTLTATVYQLQPGVHYRLYRYSSLDSVPDSEFNVNEGKAAKSWDIQIAAGSTFQVTEQFKSSDMAFYRAVKASDP